MAGKAGTKQGGKQGGKKKGAARAAGSAPSPEPEALSFEAALEQLEATVGMLEEGEMPLEQALELFEKGVRLSRQCSTTLEAAERRIETLIADRDDGAIVPFETQDFDDDWDEDDAAEA